MKPDFNAQLPKCPECGRTFPMGKEKCMWCGADLSAAQGEAPDAICPICGEVMKEEKFTQHPLFLCTRCKGIWVPTLTLEKIEKHFSEPSASKESGGASGSEAPSEPRKGGPSVTDFRSAQADMGTDQPYRRCPFCGDQMSRRPYLRISRVIVDQCMGHGTWFDPEEMDRVIEFLKTGGEKASKTARSPFEGCSSGVDHEMRDLVRTLTLTLWRF